MKEHLSYPADLATYATLLSKHRSTEHQGLPVSVVSCQPRYLYQEDPSSHC